MQILTDLYQVKPEPSCLTIGYFDGVHRGHRYLIAQALAAARRQGIRAALLTFHPHPNIVLRGAESFYLTTREEKLALLSELGLDLIVIQPFTPGLARMRAAQFVDLLVERVKLVDLWVGPDFALGYHREGNIPFLQQAGEKRGFAVNVVNRLMLEGIPICSSCIREALRQGDVTLAARGLGRLYSLHGPVVVGAQRGRSIGFPTANVEVPAERVLPARGVYAAWAHLGKARHRAVVNIGTRPTFDNGQPTVEAYVLDFDRDIYGQRLTLNFVRRLRPERHFDSVKALIAQIKQDVARARELLHVP